MKTFLNNTLLVLLALCAQSFSAYAQVPLRVMVNPSFEVPSFTPQCPTGGNIPAGGSTRGYLAAPTQPAGAGVTNPNKIVPGWETTDIDTPANAFMCAGVATGNYAPTQIFISTDPSGPPQQGLQYAELNPENPARIYQRVCVAQGESFSYSWHHRRRTPATVESARAVLCRNPSGFNQAIECGGVAADTYAVAPIHVTAATPAWEQVTGSFTLSVPGPVTAQFGFESVLPPGSSGNLIDNIQVYMRPLIDFAPTTTTLAEPATGSTLRLAVNGLLQSSATVIIRRAVSSSARYAVDYTAGAVSRGSISVDAITGDITLTLPAGSYDPNLSTGADAGLISIALNVVNDSVIEGAETFTYTLSNADITGGGGTPAGFGSPVAGLLHNLSGTSAQCSAPTSSVNFSIADNDLVSLTKSFTPTAVLQGQPFTLSFTLSSPAETATATGRITSTVVNFTDVLPTSLIAVGGTPTLSGSCLGTTPPIAANAISIGISGIQVAAGPPTGNGAATVSCVVSVPVIAAPGQVNASCAANPPVFTNSATNISTLTNAINAVVPSCVVVGAATSLSVSKSNSPTTALLAGSSTTYTVTYTNNGPGIANNALISDTPSPGLSACTVLSCTPTGGASCPALTLLDANLFTGGTPLLAFPANSSVSLQVRCGVTATGLP